VPVRALRGPGASLCGAARYRERRAAVRSPAARDGDYQAARWSNSKSGSGCLRRYQSGTSSVPPSQAGGPCAGVIGLGGLGNEGYDFRSVGCGFHWGRRYPRS
jgi:hypothetical protein